MALNEKLEKKLRKLLAKADLEEDEIDEVVEEIKSPKAAEETPDGNNPDEGTVPPSEDEKETKEEVKETVEEKQPETPAEPQPQTDGSIEQTVEGLVQGLTPAPEEQVPPAPEVPAEQPPAPAAAPELDPKYQELVAALDEEKKAREGLNARIKSLEDALRAAGILEGSAQPNVGVETPSLPESINGQGDVLSEVLSQINRK